VIGFCRAQPQAIRCSAFFLRQIPNPNLDKRDFNYGAALLNAFVITKVILIGEAAHLGKKLEAKPVIYSAIYKAFLYGLLVFAFHIVEDIIKRLDATDGHTLQGKDCKVKVAISVNDNRLSRS
jgi:hypothetical protein